MFFAAKKNVLGTSGCRAGCCMALLLMIAFAFSASEDASASYSSLSGKVIDKETNSIVSFVTVKVTKTGSGE